MKHFKLAINPIFYAVTLGELVAFVGCATDRTTFLNYGGRVPPNVMTAPQVSDGLAINYANSFEIIMRCKATQNRITREVSATAQVGLAAFGGVGAAYNWSKTTLTVLGLASAAIPQLQGIFDAKGRAEAYNQAAEMIQDGVLEYYAHNPAPSPAEFTPNGLTLVKRVASAINLVNDTINGHLPSRAAMQKAVEPMTSQGNEPQNPDEPPVNERVQTAGPAPIRKVAPIVIEKTVQLSQGLQPDAVAVITATTGKIIRSMTLEEAQAAVASLTGNQTPDPAAKTRLVDMNTDTKITAERAVQIQAAVQAAKK